MEKMEFEVSQEDAGTRIDKYLTLKLGEEYSRTYVKFLIDGGFVLVGEKTIKPHYTARANDIVFVTLSSVPDDGRIEPENIPLNIIYEDEGVIVVDKPVGLVVHPGAGNKTGTLVNALLYYCLLYTSPSPRDGLLSRMPSSA